MTQPKTVMTPQLRADPTRAKILKAARKLFVEKGFAGTSMGKIAEKASLIEDPYEQSFFLLVHMTYLQPFTDVNKRTARLSANIPLVKHNLVPLSFNDVEREDYTAAVIAIYELQEVQPLVDLYVFSYLRTCAQYDSTVKALGFDEVRVRYRAQRRALLREIIERRLRGKFLKERVASHALNLVTESDRSSFIEDVDEDLAQMDESRIAGLGITLKEFKDWQSQNQ
ncbi:MAG: TetR family transcriptional regulator [Chlamydiota bacterium]